MRQSVAVRLYPSGPSHAGRRIEAQLHFVERLECAHFVNAARLTRSTHLRVRGASKADLASASDRIAAIHPKRAIGRGRVFPPLASLALEFVVRVVVLGVHFQRVAIAGSRFLGRRVPGRRRLDASDRNRRGLICVFGPH